MGVTRAGEFIRMNMVYNKSAICKYFSSKFIGRRVHNIEMTSYWTAIRRRTDDVTKWPSGVPSGTLPRGPFSIGTAIFT